MMLEVARLVTLNGELRNVISRYIKEVVTMNDIPWFIIRAAMLEVLQDVDKECAKEIETARAVIAEEKSPTNEDGEE